MQDLGSGIAGCPHRTLMEWQLKKLRMHCFSTKSEMPWSDMFVALVCGFGWPNLQLRLYGNALQRAANGIRAKTRLAGPWQSLQRNNTVLCKGFSDSQTLLSCLAVSVSRPGQEMKRARNSRGLKPAQLAQMNNHPELVRMLEDRSTTSHPHPSTQPLPHAHAPLHSSMHGRSHHHGHNHAQSHAHAHSLPQGHFQGPPQSQAHPPNGTTRRRRPTDRAAGKQGSSPEAILSMLVTVRPLAGSQYVPCLTIKDALCIVPVIPEIIKSKRNE